MFVFSSLLCNKFEERYSVSIILTQNDGPSLVVLFVRTAIATTSGAFGTYFVSVVVAPLVVRHSFFLRSCFENEIIFQENICTGWKKKPEKRLFEIALSFFFFFFL